MNDSFALLLASFTVVGLAIGGQGLQKLTPATATLGVGRIATVCGTVGSFDCQLPDRVTLLYLDTPAEAPTFVVQILQADRAKFGLRLEDRVHLQTICVTGTIERHRGQHRLSVDQSDQLQVVDRRQPEDQLPFGDAYRSCDEGVRPPQVRRSVSPHYTSAAMSAKIRGTVLLQGVVGVDGLVHDIRVIRSLDPSGLDEESVNAFRQWQFVAGSRQGQSVAVIVTMQMTFTLR